MRKTRKVIPLIITFIILPNINTYELEQNNGYKTVQNIPVSRY